MERLKIALMFFQDKSLIIGFSVTYPPSSQLTKSFLREGKKDAKVIVKIKQIEMMISRFPIGLLRGVIDFYVSWMDPTGKARGLLGSGQKNIEA
jgi:hypothetical protein